MAAVPVSDGETIAYDGEGVAVAADVILASGLTEAETDAALEELFSSQDMKGDDPPEEGWVDEESTGTGRSADKQTWN